MLALIAAFMLCSCEYSLEDIYEADIATLRDAIQSGDLSCHDLTQFYLDRIEAYNKGYNCFITTCDAVLEIADEKDEALATGKGEGLLFGIPVVIKDNIDYKGYETTNGHIKGTGNRLVTENAYVVDRLLDEGAIILGKTNMSTEAETALNSFSEAVGDTKNAYNKDCSPGGSSGGTAVAVSLNFATAGLGTDTNSSLRIPAALNGDVALRSTFDLIDRTGIVELNPTRDVVGAITRSVADQAIMMDVLTKSKHKYYDNLKDDALDGARIGIIKELSDKEELKSSGLPADPNAYKLYKQALSDIKEAGAKLVKISLPVYKYNELCWDNDTEYLRNEFYKEFKAVMRQNKLDAMIYPDTLSPEMYLDDPASMDFFDACKYISPIIGVPDITVQIGSLPSGVTVGAGLVADRNQDQLLLNLAHSYETQFNHRTPPPNAPNLIKFK